jgi:RNA recognition motif-containing protein
LQKKPKRKVAEGEAAPAEGEAAPAAEGEAAAETKKPKAKKPKAPRAPRRAPGEDPVGEPSKNMLFVANLGFALDDAGLAALFKEAGIETKSVHVVRRRWGNPRKSKGYGFVDVGDEEGQKKGVEALNGKEVAGRPIAVKVAIDAVVKQEQAAEAEAAAAAAPEATVVAA